MTEGNNLETNKTETKICDGNQKDERSKRKRDFHQVNGDETANGHSTRTDDGSNPTKCTTCCESAQKKFKEEQKLNTIANAYKTIIQCLGEDVTREGLLRTPMRAAKAMTFFCQGYKQNLEVLLNDAVFEEDGDGMVIVRDIDFSSLCEHHLVPFKGRIHVGYIPDGKVLGLSKFVRIAEMFSRRLQVQERLTKQVAEAVEEALSPKGVAVLIQAEHMCMCMRGVQKPGANTISSCFLGSMKDTETQRKFMSSLPINQKFQC